MLKNVDFHHHSGLLIPRETEREEDYTRNEKDRRNILTSKFEWKGDINLIKVPNLCIILSIHKYNWMNFCCIIQSL